MNTTLDSKKARSGKGCSVSQRMPRLIPAIFIFMSLALCSACGSLFAETTPGNILILNSDMSIANYSLVHTRFKSRLTNLKHEIDLGSKWTDESKISDAIRNADPDVIYCIGSKAYLLAHKLAENKRLIFTSLINWRRFPMGKNTYGISTELLPNMQLMTYRYFFPEIDKIGVLYSKDYNKEWFDITVKSAKETGITIVGKLVNRQDEIASNLKELLSRVDALWLIPDPVALPKIELVEEIFKESDKAQKPVFTYSDTFAGLGATFIISSDIPTIGQQAAELAVDLLSGKKLPEKVQTPAGSHIILNLRMVEKYKIKFNMEALDSVNQIIK